MTFGDVYFLFPRGNPTGYENPLGLKKAFFWSIPSSTTAIFMPFPFAPSACSICGAPITLGDVSSAIV